jgi:hypothetical protein
VARTRVVTFADDLSATGGAEVAQLRVMEGLAGVGWQVDLLFVARGDLWPRWDALAVEARSITGSQLRRDAPLHSGRWRCSTTGSRFTRAAAKATGRSPGLCT